MSVRLISYSQGLHDSKKGIGIEIGIVESIAYCARVSNPANQMSSSTESNESLIRYLIRNHHWSPFEMVSLCLEVETTRDIARQLLRHRSFSFQEFSQRYADVSLLQTDFVLRDARIQDTKNRQNSIELSDSENGLAAEWATLQGELAAAATSAYTWALTHGIAKEQARVVLPEGMTASRLYVNGTLRSWIHYIELRSGNGTQKEHRLLALACAEAIKAVFPMISEFVC